MIFTKKDGKNDSTELWLKVAINSVSSIPIDIVLHNLFSSGVTVGGLWLFRLPKPNT